MSIFEKKNNKPYEVTIMRKNRPLKNLGNFDTIISADDRAIKFLRHSGKDEDDVRIHDISSTVHRFKGRYTQEYGKVYEIPLIHQCETKLSRCGKSFKEIKKEVAKRREKEKKGKYQK